MVAPEDGRHLVRRERRVRRLHVGLAAVDLGLAVAALERVVLPAEDGREPRHHRVAREVLVRVALRLEDDGDAAHVRVDPLVRTAVSRRLRLEVGRSVERRPRPVFAAAAQVARHGRHRREQDRRERDRDGRFPERPAGRPEEPPRGRARHCEEEPHLEVELEDRVHAVPHVDDLAPREDEKPESGERAGDANLAARTAPRRRPRRGEARERREAADGLRPGRDARA